MPRRFGFTLVELLIAISILAILSVIGIAAYSGVQKNARDARRKDDLRSIKVALEVYYQKNGQYPITDWIYSSGGQGWIPFLVPTYMARVPQDPLKNGDPRTDNQYGYAYWAAQDCGVFKAGQFFALVTQLENRADNQKNETQNYKWCDGQGLYTVYKWSAYSFVITSE